MARQGGLPVAVVGAGMIPFGELFHLGYEDMIVGSYRACLASVDHGIDEDRIEAAWLGTAAGSMIRQEIVTGASLAEPLRFFPRPVTRIENACCTGSDAVRNAAFAVAAGVYDVVLVVGAEKMRDIPSRESLIRQTSVMFHDWWAPRGATAPNRFGQYATTHMEAFGTTREHMALVAEKNHHHGSLNPNAFFRKEITCEQVLAAPMISWPLGLLDCCPTTDGAAAVILAHADIAHELSDHPIHLYGSGLATDPLISPWKDQFLAFPATVDAAAQAYEMAGIGPDDIDLAEVHDCFTITELIAYEDLGFCEKGEAKDWVERSGPMLGGERPVNTSGGLKAKGHPVGATGVAQVVELWEQLRGEAGDRAGRAVRPDPQRGRDRDDRAREHLRLRAPRGRQAVRFQDTVAIVTGAGRGIGRATALGLAAEGARVAVADLDADVAEQVVDEIRAAGGEAIAAVGSVGDRAFAEGMVRDCEARLGRVGVLVNNAGITAPAMTLKMTTEQWQRVLDVNLTGVFNCIQAVGPGFRARFEENPDIRCAGRIVNVTSVAGLRGTFGQANYGAAKAGVIGLTMSVAREWAGYRVTSNAVAFGAVETRMTEKVRTDECFREKYLDEILLHRYATPEEGAGCIMFLASADADYITGHTLNASGGLHIGY